MKTKGCDNEGNLLSGLSKTDFLPNRDTLSFVYNGENRPISVSNNGEILEEYAYDFMGRRIRKGNTVIIYDGYNAIAEYNSNSHQLKTSYAWGLDLSGSIQGAGGVGGLLSVTDHTTQIPLVSYPTYDGNGNISEYLIDTNNGTISAHYEYDAFGNVTKKTGNKDYSYQFSTKPYDSLTGLNYYNFRDYDPVSGRWLTKDPIQEQGGLNLYGFIGNNSIYAYDYLGFSGFTDSDIASCLKVEVKIEVTKYPFNEVITWEPDVPLNRKISRLGMARAIGTWLDDKIITTEKGEKCPCLKIRKAYEDQGGNSIRISVDIIKNEDNRELYVYPGGYISKTFIGVFDVVERTFTTGGYAYGDQVLPVSRRSSLIGIGVKVVVGNILLHNQSYYL